MDWQGQLFPPTPEEFSPEVTRQRKWLKALRTYEPSKQLEKALPRCPAWSGALYQERGRHGERDHSG